MCRPGEVDQVIDGTGKCVLPGISREYVVLAFGLFLNYECVFNHFNSKTFTHLLTTPF